MSDGQTKGDLRGRCHGIPELCIFDADAELRGHAPESHAVEANGYLVSWFPVAERHPKFSVWRFT